MAGRISRDQARTQLLALVSKAQSGQSLSQAEAISGVGYMLIVLFGDDT